MLRHLYCCVVYLHPPAFRRRFADEMLSIFDDTAGTSAALRLLADGLASLARQWVLRPEFWPEPLPAVAPQSATGGIPSFYTLDPFRPRAGAVIHGLVLSTAVFCLTCFAIKYSWIHLLHVHIPEIQFESPRSIPEGTRGATSERFEGPVPPRPEHKTPIGYPTAPPMSFNPPAQPRSTRMKVRKRLTRPSTASVSQEAAKGSVPPSGAMIVTEINLQSYVGTYVAQPPATLTVLISSEEEHLAMRIAGQPKYELIPVSETTFRVRGMENCWIEFTWDGDHTDGATTTTPELRLFQNGQKFTVHRQ
jgi:hypothetical protein